jgi:hypothetical protein
MGIMTQMVEYQISQYYHLDIKCPSKTMC